MLCLDEPTAGLAQRETEAFGPLLVGHPRRARRVDARDRARHAADHGISDRVYCLEAGAVIAEGTPDEVRNDPRVIASYLGTDERAIARSNTTRVP